MLEIIHYVHVAENKLGNKDSNSEYLSLEGNIFRSAIVTILTETHRQQYMRTTLYIDLF